jgi:hypothetical protein
MAVANEVEDNKGALGQEFLEYIGTPKVPQL